MKALRERGELLELTREVDPKHGLAAQFNIDSPLVFAALVSITVFTTAGIALITLFERRFLKWRPSQRVR